MENDDIRKRLTELNTKAYYLLVALSFVYRTNSTLSVKLALTLTALVAVLPLQDVFKSDRELRIVRWFKVGCLTTALGCTLFWLWCATPPAKAESPQGAAQSSESAPPLKTPQKPTTAQPTQAQLEEKIRDLEARVNAAEQKAAAAQLENDYVKS